MALAQARALECNQCGDCCNPAQAADRFSDWGYDVLPLNWGKLPKHQYRGMGGGEALIIPQVKNEDGTWGDTPWSQDMANGIAAVPFRCSAFTGDGCSLHDKKRPAPCPGFPVFYSTLDARTSPFPVPGVQLLIKCTWYDIVILPPDHPALAYVDADGNPDYANTEFDFAELEAELDGK